MQKQGKGTGAVFNSPAFACKKKLILATYFNRRQHEKRDSDKNPFEKKNLVKLAPAAVVIAAVAAAGAQAGNRERSDCWKPQRL